MPQPDPSYLFLGASGGIGQALASLLLKEGAHLVLAGRQIDALEHFRQSHAEYTDRITTVALDLGAADCAEQITALADNHPELTGLIHCAGQNEFAAIDALTPDAIDRMLNVNLRSALLLAHVFVPRFRLQSQGLIVNVGSTFGSIGFPGYTAYCATKFGLRGFTEALRRELADTNIRVLYMAPRATQTEMNSNSVNGLNKSLGNHVDAPEVVAQEIAQAIRQRRSQTFIGWPEKLFARINGILPGIVDGALKKQLPTINQFLKEKS